MPNYPSFDGTRSLINGVYAQMTCPFWIAVPSSFSGRVFYVSFLPWPLCATVFSRVDVSVLSTGSIHSSSLLKRGWREEAQGQRIHIRSSSFSVSSSAFPDSKVSDMLMSSSLVCVRHGLVVVLHHTWMASRRSFCHCSMMSSSESRASSILHFQWPIHDQVQNQNLWIWMCKMTAHTKSPHIDIVPLCVL